jgi:uncharacterized protein (DUF4415 family)
MKWKAIIIRQERDEWCSTTEYAFVPVKPKRKKHRRMRRAKRDRSKPIAVADLQQIAKFRAELQVYAKLRADGKTHDEAMRALYAEDMGV